MIIHVLLARCFRGVEAIIREVTQILNQMSSSLYLFKVKVGVGVDDYRQSTDNRFYTDSRFLHRQPKLPGRARRICQQNETTHTLKTGMCASMQLTIYQWSSVSFTQQCPGRSFLSVVQTINDISLMSHCSFVEGREILVSDYQID